MNRFSAEDIIVLFKEFSDVFSEQKEFLIALDGKVGDSDLGLTMAKGFGAASTALSESKEESIENLFKVAGSTIAKTAPSTMGTLVATGFIRGSVSAKGCDAIGTKELASFWTAFKDGVAQRGHAELGDKTVLDILHPIAEILVWCSHNDIALPDALERAAKGAREALEETKDLVAQRGKAAAFQEKTRGIQDAGSTVAVILIETMSEFSSRK